MNNCSQAPLCDATRAAADEFLASWNTDGMDWERWIHEVELAKREFALLINAEPDEIAAVTSVSHATSVIATAIDLGGRRNAVVAAAGEFPTVGHVWLAQDEKRGGAGASVSWVPVREGALEVEDYAALIDERTALVSATHAYYVNGFVQDIAHQHGALVFVDAYQSVGTMPVDVKAAGVDFLAAGTLKFLMGTPGIAFLYARREVIAGLHPLFTGWFGRANPFAFETMRLDWSPTASRFEAGTPSVFSAYVARAGMSLLNEVGLEAIGRWNALLSRRLVEKGRAGGLTIYGPGLSRPKTPTTAFVCPGDAQTVEAGLRRRGVIASARGSVIRLAPHFYSSVDDVDSAVEALAAELES